MIPEWIVIRPDAAHAQGYDRHQTDGRTGEGRSPRVMFLPDAIRVRDSLGDGWLVVHYVTMVSDPDHAKWTAAGGKVKVCEHCGLPVKP